MNQGEIWRISLDPTIGAEINKSRPAIIISTNVLGKLPLKIIAPITDWKEQFCNYPWMVKITPTKQNCLIKVSAIDCFQVRSVSVERFAELVGSAAPEIITQIQEAVVKVIGSV